METNKEKIMKKLAEAKKLIGEAEDLAIDEKTVVEKITSDIKEFTSWLGLTTDKPTATELKEKVEEIKDKTADATVVKTLDEVEKKTETKAEETKATQPDDTAKGAVAKTKEAVKKGVEEVKEAKEAIKAEVKKIV